jgi:acyl carrier protein
LLERGIVDSTGVLELVGFLERQYQLVVEDRELLPANLDSIDRLVAFVKRKTSVEPDASAD